MSRHKRPARFRKGSVFQATANRILSASAASAVSNTAQRNRTSSSPSIPSRKTGKFRVSSAMPTILKNCNESRRTLMNKQELITAVSNKLPVKVLLLNNGCLGMVRQLQDLFYGGRLNAVDIPDQPDFVKLAEAYGAEATASPSWKILNPRSAPRLPARTRPSSTSSSSATKTCTPLYPPGLRWTKCCCCKNFGRGNPSANGSLPSQGASPFLPFFQPWGGRSEGRFKSANAYWNGGCAEKP